MKYINLLLLLCTIACVSENQSEIHVPIIPQPNKMEIEKGNLKLDREIVLLCNTETLVPLAEKFKTEVADRISVKVEGDKKATIKLDLIADLKNDESYFLQISKKLIIIQQSYLKESLLNQTK